MIARIVIAAVGCLFIATIAFGQTKYGASRSASPAPTPTPTPALQPVPGLNKSQLQGRRPSPAPTPGKAIPQMRATPAPMQAKPTPQPRTMPTPIQGRATPAPRAASMPAQAQTTPAPIPAKPTPTPVPPPDIKTYLGHQLASSKDKKFHFTVNGKDLALTPFHVWMQKSTGPNTTSTCIDMTSDEGRVYDIDFLTAGSQVSAVRIHTINGETVR